MREGRRIVRDRSVRRPWIPGQARDDKPAAMRLQTATRLALFAVIDLAGAPGVARSATELAETHRASIAHMAKVMQTLARAGLVAPLRGAQGGYRFAANPRRTTLLDVIEQFEPVAVTGDAANASSMDPSTTRSASGRASVEASPARSSVATTR